ncbi:MAG: PilZ domain-containing protein [Gemmatimonadales bacterium]
MPLLSRRKGFALDATEKQRRSTRVLVNIPIIVSGVNSRGQTVTAAGETEIVNKHGAKIRVLEWLEKGMRLQVTLPTRKLTRPASVVWVDERDRTEAEVEFGVELESAENFWGIYFPPDDWEEPEVSAAEAPALSLPSARVIDGAAVSPSPRSPAAAFSRASGDGHFAIPAKGAEVFVRGMSAVHIPFQEKTLLRPVGEGEATIDVRPVVDIGITLQVIFPHSPRGVKARTSAVGDRRHEGRWRMWIKFLDPVEFAAPAAPA